MSRYVVKSYPERAVISITFPDNFADGDVIVLCRNLFGAKNLLQVYKVIFSDITRTTYYKSLWSRKGAYTHLKMAPFLGD